MWATVVALACGVIGVVAVLVAVSTGHKFDHASSQAVVDPGLAELWHDFAALQAPERRVAQRRRDSFPAPEPVNTGTATPPLASRSNPSDLAVLRR
jgi:hypothetical protein